MAYNKETHEGIKRIRQQGAEHEAKIDQDLANGTECKVSVDVHRYGRTWYMTYEIGRPVDSGVSRV